MHRLPGKSVFASLSRRLAMPDNIRLRIESFGGIAFGKSTGTLVELDRDAAALLHYVQNAGTVAEDTLAVQFTDPKVRGVVEKLLDLGVLCIASSSTKVTPTPSQSIQWPPGPKLTAPETVHWAITYRCDQQCPDCYARRYSSSFTSELDTASAMRLMDILAEWGVFQLAIGGGEPLLRPDLAQIIKHAQQNGLVVHITTGYHSVSDQMLRSLSGSVAVLQVGVKHERLLADPAAEIRKLSNSIMSARDYGITVGVNMMLSNTVLAHFNELINCLVQADVHRITLLRYKPPANSSQWILENPSSDVWNDFELQLHDAVNRHPEVTFRLDCALSFLQRKLDSGEAASLGIRGCVAGERILALAPDASAYPCSQLIRPDLPAGNLLRDNPADLWAQWDESSNSRCGMCSASDFCGGCRVFFDDSTVGDTGCPEVISCKECCQ